MAATKVAQMELQMAVQLAELMALLKVDRWAKQTVERMVCLKAETLDAT